MNPLKALLAILGSVLLFLVAIALVVVESLLKTMTLAMVLGSMVFAAIVLILALIRTGGVAMTVDEDGGPSRADIEAGDMEWTVGGDGCSAGDAIKTDAPRSVKEKNGRPATAEAPFEPRRSPRFAAQTQTRVEPRKSARIAANRVRANSLRNVGLQPRRSARIAAARLTGGA